MQEGKTIGLIVPSEDTNIEAFYHRYAPNGVTVATNRIAHNGVQIKSLEAMVSSSEKAAIDLCPVEPDILISTSLTLGCFLDTTLHKFIRQRTGVPCITSIYTLLKILKFAPSARLSILMPFQEDVNELFVKTLTQNGVDVCYVESLSEESGGCCKSIQDLQKLDLYTLVSNMNLPAIRETNANYLLIGASGIGGVEEVRKVEDLLGIPILFPEQLTLLYAMNYLDCYEPIEELGKVFQMKSYDSITK